MRPVAVLALLVILAGCVQPPPARTASSTAQYAKTIHEHAPFKADDGVMLDMDVFRPDTNATGEKVPVIINYSPYWSNLEPPQASGGDQYSSYLIEHFVKYGYAVALVAVRGTGLSEGCFDIGGPREVKDAGEIADWLATQPWSNGNISATAKSYDGTAANYLLTTDNAHVKTIVPVSAISDWYRYGFYGGVTYTTQNAFNTVYVDTVSVRQNQDPRNETYSKTASRFCPESAEVEQAQYQSQATGDYTAYWQARNYTAALPKTMHASVFLVHGLQDWNVKPDHLVDWVPALHARNVTVKEWLGQWHHEYPHRGDWNETLLRWFDSELKGIPNGIRDDPLVQVQDDSGIWRDEHEWPPARAKAMTLYPSADGSLGPAAGTGASMYGDAPNGILGNAPMLSSLTFTSKPTDRAIRITGAPWLNATISATSPRGTIAVALYVDKREVDQTFLDLAHRDGLASSTPMVPGQSYHVAMPFYQQDIVVPKGSVLSLYVSSVAPPDANVNITSVGAGGLVTLSYGADTTLSLPFIEGSDVKIEAVQPADLGCWTCE